MFDVSGSLQWSNSNTAAGFNTCKIAHLHQQQEPDLTNVPHVVVLTGTCSPHVIELQTGGKELQEPAAVSVSGASCAARPGSIPPE